MDGYGLVHIYCGDGKGKTTAAVGLAVRAAGSGAKVLFVQLMKDGASSELNILKSIENITVTGKSPVNKFSFAMTDEEKCQCRIYNDNLVREAADKLDCGYQMIVIDESIGAVNKGLLDEDIVLELLKKKNNGTEIVLTGRNPSSRVLEQADYISEIKKIKHPFDEHITARKGIEK